ncbi:MAG: hypothetical protein C0497_05480 [Gemmatimonas sp.]|nr:hypothetical protein [Gemmatimonas sp.]
MQRLARFSVLQGSRRRALLALSGASVGDFFVPALPTQTSVIALGLLQPQRAAWIALAFAAAAAVGAGLLAVLMTSVSGYAQQFGIAQFGDEWTRITERAREYGVWAVLLASIFPTPPRLLTAATLLAGAAAGLVIAAVFAGKLIWFAVFLLLLTRAPQRLARLPLLGSALARFECFRAGVLAEQAARG